ncbi:MAG: ABC transporter substrate-binding protein [Lachnospiraceae bacterium]|nr:ABC transporter substrate-binding protein [Lachnospiraceae bacterium]
MKKKLVSLLMAATLSLGMVFGGVTAMAAEAEQESPVGNGETIYVGQTNIVKSMDPTDSSVPWALTAHGVSESIFMLDEEGNTYSRFIDSLEQTDDNDWTLKMKTGVKFSDGSDVTANSICDCMNEVIEKNGLSNATAGKLEFTAVDDTTFTVHTERMTKQMVSVLTEWTNIVFKHLDNGEYAFTGPYMIENLDPGVEISMTPNPYYDDQAENRPNVVIKAFKDTSAMQLAFEGGEIDMAFTVTPDVAEILEAEGYTVKNIDAGYQYFGIMNLERAPLDDLNVRKAVNAALNREDMLTALKGGSVATGFFAHYYSFAGDVEITTSTDDAAAYLEEAGWTQNDSGNLEKDGEELSLKLVTYASRPDLTIIMQLAAAQLNELGIQTTTEIVDSIDETGRSGEYDIMFYAQHTAPTADPAFALNQFFRQGEGKNFNNYSSDKVVELLDQMGTMEPGEERDALAVEVQDVVYEDLPVLFLVDPQWHIAVSDKLADYTPYCGDYYVINPKLGLE